VKSWYEIYSERMNSRYTQHVADRYAPFIQELYEVRATSATEIGCGAGNITRILREMKDLPGFHYGLIDSCPKMLSLAVENNQALNCAFMCADVRELIQSDVDLIHSHGLLEHFDDSDIRHIVKMCRMASPIQIHYVPGIKYEKSSRGDERLMDVSEWANILQGLGKLTVKTFNDGYDYILRLETR
jgi:trans-aconitate methyltransferase